MSIRRNKHNTATGHPSVVHAETALQRLTTEHRPLSTSAEVEQWTLTNPVVTDALWLWTQKGVTCCDMQQTKDTLEARSVAKR